MHSYTPSSPQLLFWLSTVTTILEILMDLMEIWPCNTFFLHRFHCGEVDFCVG